MASGYFENRACGLYQPHCPRSALAPLLGVDLHTADLFEAPEVTHALSMYYDT